MTLGRDYLPAFESVVSSLAPGLQATYEALSTGRGASNRYTHLLWAGVLTPDASFTLDELVANLSVIEGKTVTRQSFAKHLGELLHRGLLEKIREGLYRLQDPALRMYVRLRLRSEQPQLMGEDPLQLALPY